MAEGTTVANAFVQIMPSMEGATSNITSAVVPELTKAGDKAGAGFGSVFAGKAGTAIKALGGVLAGVFAVGAIKDAFTTVESGFNNVKIATGATGEAANELKEVYLETSKNVVGSFEDIGSAVGELNTRFGLHGEELEAASEAAMKYAKVTGQDATQAVQDVARMMNNAGIPASEYAETLDKLTVAGQAAGIDVGKLAETVTANASSFKQMGFSTDEAIAMLSQFELSGANTSKILSGMSKGVANWAKDGKTASEGFAEFVQGVSDGSVTVNDAIELFGSKAGVEMYEAAQKGQLSFEGMFQTITEGSSGALDSVYQDTLTVGEKLDLLGQQLQAGVFEVVEPILEALMPYIDMLLGAIGSVSQSLVDVLVPAMEQVTAFITPIIDEVLPEFQSVFDEVNLEIQGVAAEVWPSIQEIVTTAISTIMDVMKLVWPYVKDLVLSVVKAIASFMKETWPAISETIKTAMDTIKQIIDFAWPYIKQVIEVVSGAIKTVIDTVWPIVSEVIKTAAGAIKTVIEDVWPTIQTVIETISGGIKTFTEEVWPVISGAVETAAGAIKTAIEGIESVVNTVKTIFNDVKKFIEDPLGTAQGVVKDFADTIEGIMGGLDLSLPDIALPHFSVWGGEFPYGIGGYGSPPTFDVQWYGIGGFADTPTLTGYAERGLEFYWPSYEPYFDMYAQGIAEHMPTNGVDIHDCTFVVRKDSDIRAVAVELNTLINRQTMGAIR